MTWRRSEQSYGCQFERDNPEPPPVKCDCPSCECDSDYAGPVLKCGEWTTAWIVQLEDGEYVRSCCADAHGVPIQWAGELHAYPVKETSFTQMLREMYPEELIEQSIERRLPIFGWLGLHRPGRYGVIEID